MAIEIYSGHPYQQYNIIRTVRQVVKEAPGGPSRRKSTRAKMTKSISTMAIGQILVSMLTNQDRQSQGFIR